MEQNILVSVIVPVYNVKKYLDRCVTSICAQTYDNLEILLVDDGSVDGSAELCDLYAKKDDRIRVIHKPNGGTSSARNEGIRQAAGEYLTFVDSDDFISPQMYQKMVEKADTEGASIVQAGRDELDDRGNRLPDVCTPPEQAMFQSSEEFLRELLLHRGDSSFCTKLLKRDLLAGREFPEGRLNEDFFLLVQLLENVEGVHLLPEQMYHVFCRIGSNTRTGSRSKFSRVFIDIVEYSDVVYDLVVKKHPGLKEEAVRFCLYQRLDYMLHIPVEEMTGDNSFYQRVKAYLRRSLRDTLVSPYLTGKNKLYLLLLTAAPRMVRRFHGMCMRLRGAD